MEPSRQISQSLAFFRSVVKCGEGWTATCQRDYDAPVAALAALAELTPAPLPAAITEQACTISKTGSTVTVECDNPDLANQFFDWLAAK